MDATTLNLALWPSPSRLLAVSNLVNTHARSDCLFTFGLMPVVAYSGSSL